MFIEGFNLIVLPSFLDWLFTYPHIDLCVALMYRSIDLYTVQANTVGLIGPEDDITWIAA